jgi:hypothetical protein
MASVLKVNTLTGVTTAGSIAVTGEGNSTTTNLQQGLCKAWHLSSDAAVPTDSFNISGGTDNGTGDYSYAFSNNMGNVNYAPSGLCATDDRNAQFSRSRAADTYRVLHYGHDDAYADVINSGSIVGDLA